MNTLVTGGAGYIGSHVTYALLDAGHDVVVLDNLSTGVRDNVAEAATFVQGDLCDAELLGRTLAAHDVQAILHFAGSIVVPESVAHPIAYYHNNTSNMLTLLRECVAHDVRHFVFSSTAAVYGAPDGEAVSESSPVAPLNPYGHSKLFSEQILRDVCDAHDMTHMILRYFNVAGADPQGRTGQSTPDATHLIKVACQAALGRRERLELFGTDYDTPDGTGVRDYIHVSDLARAHVLALEALERGGHSATLNCGYGHGYSVREVIDVVREVSEVAFPVLETSRRPGDSPSIVANAQALRDSLAWEPAHDDLSKMVRTALAWERTLRYNGA